MTAIQFANHVWQSTIVAGVAWLITIALRRNHAAARHAVWLAASLKFLVPFALLVSAGSQLGWRTVEMSTQPQVTVVFETIGQPFSSTSAGVIRAMAPAPRFPIGVTSVLMLVFAVWCAA
jgi:bla regulator protein blaR1